MNNNSINCAVIEEWINSNYTEKAAEDSLVSRGFERSTISQYIMEFKRLRMAKMFFVAIMIVSFSTVIGVFTLLVHG